MRWILIIWVLSGASLCGQVDNPHWAQVLGGASEVRLEDGTRCDVLTATHAWEIERGRDWMEAVGQSLHYAGVTRRRAGIVLVIQSGEERHAQRLHNLIANFDLPIDIRIYHERNDG